MKQRITAVQQEIVYDSVEKGQKMETDNGCNKPTEEFSGSTFEFTDNSRCFFPTSSHNKRHEDFYFFFIVIAFSFLFQRDNRLDYLYLQLCFVIINLGNCSGQD